VDITRTLHMKSYNWILRARVGVRYNRWSAPIRYSWSLLDDHHHHWTAALSYSIERVASDGHRDRRHWMDNTGTRRIAMCTT